MNNKLNQLKNKIKLLLSIINTEYKNIIEQYNEDNLYVKSLPLKPSKKCSKVQKDMISKQLEYIFISTQGNFIKYYKIVIFPKIW